MQATAADVDEAYGWWVSRLVNIASNSLVGDADGQSDYDDYDDPAHDAGDPAEIAMSR
jgi:hypothetical protein